MIVTVRGIVQRTVLNEVFDDDSGYTDVAQSVADEVEKRIGSLGRQCRLKHGSDGHAGKVGVVCKVFQSGRLSVFFDQLNILSVLPKDVEWVDEVPDRPVTEAGKKEDA